MSSVEILAKNVLYKNYSHVLFHIGRTEYFMHKQCEVIGNSFCFFFFFFNQKTEKSL